MSSADNWDDDDWGRRRRPRRAWEDDLYEDLPSYRSEPSGGVTSVAVACFIWAGLFLLFSGCLGFCLLVATGGGGRPPAGAVGLLGGQESILALRVLGFFTWSVGALVAGVGLVARRTWGRVLALVLGAFAGLGGIGTLIEVIYEYTQAPNAPGIDHGMMMFGFMFGLVLGLLLVVFALWSLIVLLNPRCREEFK